jgi:hypothetical protein
MIIFVILINLINIFQPMINVNELQPGDSFIYKTDKGKVAGFFLIDKEVVNKKIKWLNFGLVVFKDTAVSTIEDFKKGELFTHKVWDGLDGDYETGIQCYDFSSKGFDFLEKFQYLGNIKFERKKFTIGGGSTFTNEMFINLDVNNMEGSNAKYERKPLSFIFH